MPIRHTPTDWLDPVDLGSYIRVRNRSTLSLLYGYGSSRVPLVPSEPQAANPITADTVATPNTNRRRRRKGLPE